MAIQNHQEVHTVQKKDLKLMIFENGTDKEIRYRLLSRWLLISSSVSDTEKMFYEIEKYKPDVVVINLDLYERIGGIETMQMIKDRFDVNIWSFDPPCGMQILTLNFPECAP